jgi:hypothetical protein
MSVNLNEFSSAELQTAIDLFVDRVDYVNRQLQNLEDFSDSEFKEDAKREFNLYFDTLLLWKVQLENALQEVIEREKITNS